MEQMGLGKSDVSSSRLVYGCMRIADDAETGRKALRAALEAGYTHFDHADVYGGGRSEELFGELLTEDPTLREHVLLTSKCGIRLADEPSAGVPYRFDFSRDYITQSVEQSLKRLNTDHLDLLLLHRPDYLFNADDVAGTFELLQQSGKVLHFGCSNFLPSQLSLLQSRCSMPMLVNQVQLNIHCIDPLSNGILDQCQMENITPMAWCPLGGTAYPAWGNTFTETDEARIKAELTLQTEKYNAEPTVVILAWLLKLPAHVIPVIGSTTPERIQRAVQALDLAYTHADWYRLLEARNGKQLD